MALKTYQNALKIADEVYNLKPHQEYVTILSYLGNIYLKRNEIHIGLEYLKKAFDMNTLLFGYEHKTSKDLHIILEEKSYLLQHI